MPKDWPAVGKNMKVFEVTTSEHFCKWAFAAENDILVLTYFDM